MGGVKYEQREKLLSSTNRKLWHEYKEWMLENRVNTRQYSGIAIEFIEKSSLDNIIDANIDDVAKFMIGKTPKLHAFLKKFLFGFLSSQYELKFTENEYDILRPQENKDKEGAATVLSIEDICVIRQYLFDKPVQQIIFEMVYSKGIELKYFHSYIDYDSETGICILRECNLTILELKNNLNQGKLKNKIYADCLDMFRKLGEQCKKDGYLNRYFTYQDIWETHKYHRIQCPICPNAYPRTSEYWVLAQYKQDKTETKWLICKECAANLGKESNG